MSTFVNHELIIYPRGAPKVGFVHHAHFFKEIKNYLNIHKTKNVFIKVGFIHYAPFFKEI